MPDKLIRMQRSTDVPLARPTVLAIAGDSASGKTTLARGILTALGSERCASICVDDYHRYDREERRSLPFTALHPDCNHVDVMEQHLQLLALGRPVLKPVYDHTTGRLVRPEYVEPREFLIVEGLLPLTTKLSRACFDISVYLDTDEDLRRTWKLERDVSRRGYARAEVLAELDRRAADAAAFIRPQRSGADIVVRTRPDGPPEHPPSVDLLLRSHLRHPALIGLLAEDQRASLDLTIVRDEGTPTDLLHLAGGMPAEDAEQITKTIWSALGRHDGPPETLGQLADGTRTAPLAITQLVLLHHLLRGARS